MKPPRAARDYTIVLYDHACPMCRTEMTRLKKRDALNRLRLVNIAHPAFDAAAWGFDAAALSDALHARTPQGDWLIGMTAIRHVYAQVRLGWLMAPSGWPLLAPMFDRCYLMIARRRMALSRWLPGGGAQACDGSQCAVMGSPGPRGERP